MSSIRTKFVAGAAVAGAAIGGAALANAASTTNTTQAPQAAYGQPPQGARPGRHTVDGRTEQALTGDVAARVRSAALARVPGTVERVETNVDGSAPYEAHIKKADGTEVEVQVAGDYAIAAVNAMPGHP